MIGGSGGLGSTILSSLFMPFINLHFSRKNDVHGFLTGAFCKKNLAFFQGNLFSRVKNAFQIRFLKQTGKGGLFQGF